MAEYKDISNIEIPNGFFDDLNVPKLLAWLKSLPTADVVPKSEVNEIIGTFEVLLYKHYNGDITEREFYRLFAELKKKYTEG